MSEATLVENPAGAQRRLIPKIDWDEKYALWIAHEAHPFIVRDSTLICPCGEPWNRAACPYFREAISFLTWLYSGKDNGVHVPELGSTSIVTLDTVASSALTDDTVVFEVPARLLRQSGKPLPYPRVSRLMGAVA